MLGSVAVHHNPAGYKQKGATVNPMILVAPEGAKNVPKCTSCFSPAALVWIDQWGTVPLCRECGDNREKAWKKRQEEGKK